MGGAAGGGSGAFPSRQSVSQSSLGLAVAPDRLSSRILGASAAGRHQGSNGRAGFKRYKHTYTHTHPLETEEKSCWTGKQTDGRMDGSETPRNAGGWEAKDTRVSRGGRSSVRNRTASKAHTNTHTRKRGGESTKTLCTMPPPPSFGRPSRPWGPQKPNLPANPIICGRGSQRPDD